MEDRLGEVDVAEMAGTLGHVAGAGLAAGGAVHRPLTRVHQAAQLGPPALVSFRISRRNSKTFYCTVPRIGKFVILRYDIKIYSQNAQCSNCRKIQQSFICKKSAKYISGKKSAKMQVLEKILVTIKAKISYV